jgi:hypothetical protein
LDSGELGTGRRQGKHQFGSEILATERLAHTTEQRDRMTASEAMRDCDGAGASCCFTLRSSWRLRRKGKIVPMCPDPAGIVDRMRELPK